MEPDELRTLQKLPLTSNTVTSVPAFRRMSTLEEVEALEYTATSRVV